MAVKTMMDKLIDLRSDTVTKPSPAMRVRRSVTTSIAKIRRSIGCRRARRKYSDAKPASSFRPAAWAI